METVAKKTRLVKPTIGYRGSECGRSGSARHYWIDFHAILPFDVGAALTAAATANDQKRLERFATIAKLAEGRPVYTSDGDVSVCWQTENTSKRWYAPTMSLIGNSSGQRPLHAIILKAALADGGSATPVSLIEKLGAIRVESLRGDDGHSISVGCSYAYVVEKAIDPTMVLPWPTATSEVEEMAVA